MTFDHWEHTPPALLHDRVRPWKGGLDGSVKKGVEKPQVLDSARTREFPSCVVHGREAFRLYCCWTISPDPVGRR